MFNTRTEAYAYNRHSFFQTPTAAQLKPAANTQNFVQSFTEAFRRKMRNAVDIAAHGYQRQSKMDNFLNTVATLAEPSHAKLGIKVGLFGFTSQGSLLEPIGKIAKAAQQRRKQKRLEKARKMIALMGQEENKIADFASGLASELALVYHGTLSRLPHTAHKHIARRWVRALFDAAYQNHFSPAATLTEQLDAFKNRIILQEKQFKPSAQTTNSMQFKPQMSKAKKPEEAAAPLLRAAFRR